MTIINKWIIPNTKNKYELHLIEYTENKTDWEVWSNISKKHLKDTTAFKKYRGLMRTYGINFSTDQEIIQKKIYLKDIIKLCKAI